VVGPGSSPSGCQDPRFPFLGRGGEAPARQ
jgi:hypothetical protein